MCKALNQRQEVSALVGVQCMTAQPRRLLEQQAEQVSQKRVATSLVDQLHDTRFPVQPIITDMRLLTKGIRSEKMRRWAISSLCEHHTVYLHKPR